MILLPSVNKVIGRSGGGCYWFGYQTFSLYVYDNDTGRLVLPSKLRIKVA